MINKTGELVDFLIEAASNHGCSPHTDVRVRIGTLGAEYRINQVKAVEDQRGRSLLLELCVVPEGGG